METEIYLAHDAAETQRSLAISLLGVDPGDIPGQILAPANASLREWKTWIDTVFHPIICPHLDTVFHATAATRHREIFQADRDFSRHFSETENARSREAGKIFDESKTDARHLTPWLRFEEKIRSGETPGHLATLTALQGALFNVPLLSARTGYLWFEWRASRTEFSFEEIVALQKKSSKTDGEFLRAV